MSDADLLRTVSIDLDAAVPAMTMTTLNTNTLWYQSNGDIDLNITSLLLVTNVALIADADSNGVGTLNLGNTLTVIGDLRVEGADIIAEIGGSLWWLSFHCRFKIIQVADG